MWLALLHAVGLTNLSDEQVQDFYKRQLKNATADKTEEILLRLEKIKREINARLDQIETRLPQVTFGQAGGIETSILRAQQFLRQELGLELQQELGFELQQELGLFDFARVSTTEQAERAELDLALQNLVAARKKSSYRVRKKRNEKK